MTVVDLFLLHLFLVTFLLITNFTNMSKPPLLLLHGALGSSASFAKLLPELENEFDSHLLDFSGHGNSPLAEDFSIVQFAKDTVNYMNNHNLDKVDIFGYSMGGYVALWLCYTVPERVNKVFTLGSKIVWDRQGVEKELAMLNTEAMLLSIPKFVELLKQRHTQLEWFDLVKYTREMMIELGERNLLSEPVLSSINHTVRLGVGDKDHTAGVEDSMATFRLIPEAQFHVFPNTPHPLEKVDLHRLSYSIKEFFNS